MNSIFAAWLDLVSALGLIVALSFAYARFRRAQRFRRLCEIALGASFGIVALLEMNQPIEPIAGLIVDLRNVPIALAGAFLNLPGALVALGFGLVGRVSIGGVGMWSGMLGMVLAFGAGRLWAHWYSGAKPRGVKAMFALAGIMSFHLLGALILPADVAVWFYLHVAPTILLLNVLTVPLLAASLEAERRSFNTEGSLRASATVDQDTGLLPLEALQRECAVRATALADGSYTHALVVSLRSGDMVSIWNTDIMRKRLMAAMRLRLDSALPNCDLASVVGTSLLVLPLTQAEILDMDGTKTRVRRAATEDPYALTGFGGHRISIDCEVVDLEAKGSVIEGFGTAQKRSRQELMATHVRHSGVPHVGRAPNPVSPRLSDPKEEHLFAKANFLMARNMSGRIGSSQGTVLMYRR